MAKPKKTLETILRGTADANVGFAELVQLLSALGFEERTKGDHHIFFRADIEEILNLQPHGAKAKNYQVKQVRRVLIKYKLGEAL